ncbi:uncharacterized protein LOC106766467 isoform X1 [Vigna radiata var. radiata]|uniref:Uncharacterized protein LOC106766467 isoform X1 n=1 Tax=Vigna radiata var. radiata TaxID=3916 RepID=A0A3Q0EUX5_VIGRR|nr:uncharacterized protein LOC106766467 isoform X1 [Vigna radiata var. radiata]
MLVIWIQNQLKQQKTKDTVFNYVNQCDSYTVIVLDESMSKSSGSCNLSIKAYCVFQDLATGKTILTAKEQSGLYFLEFDDQSNTKIMSQQATYETWAKSQIWLHHQRLGHPSFSLTKSLFPHLFTKESVESFNCDICQFSKSHRVSYPISHKA